jgi:protein-tyrosine phosphatase
MARSWQTVVVTACVLVFAAGSYFYFRAVYSHNKRLRVVVPGRFYRCGQLTADGFTEAVERFGIRTIINVQEDVPDPDLLKSYTDRTVIKESDLCRKLGVHYVWFAPDLVSRRVANPRPKVIDEFLALMDDQSTYPALIHCKAGLHRTGLLTAVYRMQYQGWSPATALRELKANGFGEWVASGANDYVYQYVLRYTRRRQTELCRPAATP